MDPTHRRGALVRFVAPWAIGVGLASCEANLDDPEATSGSESSGAEVPTGGESQSSTTTGTSDTTESSTSDESSTGTGSTTEAETGPDLEASCDEICSADACAGWMLICSDLCASDLVKHQLVSAQCHAAFLDHYACQATCPADLCVDTNALVIEACRSRVRPTHTEYCELRLECEPDGLTQSECEYYAYMAQEIDPDNAACVAAQDAWLECLIDGGCATISHWASACTEQWAATEAAC